MKIFDRFITLLKTFSPEEVQEFVALISKTKRGHEELGRMVQYLHDNESPTLNDAKAQFAHALKKNPSRVFRALFSLAFKSLSGSGHSALTTMMELEMQVHVLVRRKEYRLAILQIQYAAEVAQKQEHFMEGRKLVMFLDDMLEAGGFSRYMIPPDFDYNYYERWFWERMVEMRSYKDLQSKLARHSKVTSGERDKLLSEVSAGLDTLSAIPHLSRRAEMLCHRMRYRVACHRQDFADAAAEMKKITEAYEANPGLADDPGTHIQYLTDLMLIGVCHQIEGNLEMAMLQVERLTQVAKQDEGYAEEAQLRLVVLKTQLALYLKTIDPQSVILEADKLLLNFPGGLKSDYSLTLVYHASTLCLFVGQPQKAIRFLAPLVGNTPLPGSIRRQMICLLLFLISHCQNENYEVVIQQTPVVVKRLKSIGQYSNFESLIVAMLGELASAIPSDKLEVIAKVRKELAAFFSTPDGLSYKDFFDFEKWFNLMEEKLR
jgi:hypothetical protein